MSRTVDITGQVFGRLTVIESAGSHNKRARWLCRCNCGNEKIVDGQSLRRGHVKSCGCFRREVSHLRTHGQTGTRLFKAWDSMRQRCRNSGHHAFGRYGGRGILICSDWERFEAFRDWAIANGYASDLTIDRIDNHGNYEPGNCRWIPKSEQNRNKSNLRPVVRSDGKRFATIADAARDIGCAETTISDACKCRRGRTNAVGYGWSYDQESIPATS